MNHHTMYFKTQDRRRNSNWIAGEDL